MQMKSDERGGARLKFIIAIVVLAVVFYVGYLYVPVAVDAYYFKDIMQTKVDMAATQGYDMAWVTDQLKKSESSCHVPGDATIGSVPCDNNCVGVRVQFTRPIAFIGFTYNYDFDYTAKSTTFFTSR